MVDIGAHMTQASLVRIFGKVQTAKEGDIGRALFILESGKIELTKLDETGKPQPLYTVQPGEFFGEMALLEQLPRTATASASERAHVYLLYRSKLDGLLLHEPRIGATIMGHLARILSARLRRLTSRGSLSGSAAAAS